MDEEFSDEERADEKRALYSLLKKLDLPHRGANEFNLEAYIDGDLAVEGAIEEVENNEEYSEEYKSEFDVQTVLESMLRTVMTHVYRRFDTKSADKLISHIRKQTRIFHLVGDDGAHLLMSDLANRMKKRGAEPSDLAILSKMNELAEGAPEQEQDLIDQFIKDQERQ